MISLPPNLRRFVPFAVVLFLGLAVGYSVRQAPPTLQDRAFPGQASPAASSAPTAAPVAEQTVFVTRTGRKYHLAGCKALRLSSIAISLKDAQARGYTPCKICFGGE